MRQPWTISLQGAVEGRINKKTWCHAATNAIPKRAQCIRPILRLAIFTPDMATFHYQDLIGKPYSKEEFNCWHLVMELHRRQGIMLPDYPSDRELYEKLESAEDGCIVHFRIEGEEMHVGVVVDDALAFIHVMEGQQAVRQPLNDWRWERRILGFYKWRGLRNSEFEEVKCL